MAKSKLQVRPRATRLDERRLPSVTLYPERVGDFNRQPLPVPQAEALRGVGATAYFTEYSSAFYPTGALGLWRTNGTASGTARIHGSLHFGNDSTTEFVSASANGPVFFAANNFAAGTELWKTDGTSSGTVLVADIRPGTFGSNPRGLTAFGGRVYFRADDGCHGSELWRSNGTSSGTLLVRDVNAGGNANPANLTAHDGALYFTANSSNTQAQLWRTDGTSAGTWPLTVLNESTSWTQLTSTPDGLYFRNRDTSAGIELWRTDGTSNGTVRCADVWSGPSSSYPSMMTEFNGTLVFTATDGYAGRELWILRPDAGPPQAKAATPIVAFVGAHRVGKEFALAVEFDQSMDDATTPAISFLPPATSGLQFTGGSWASRTTYIARYAVMAGFQASDVDVTVSGGQDMAGKATVASTMADVFTIDTTPPRATVTIDGGTAQRSRVRSVTVTFNQPVDLANAAAMAFALTGPNGPITVVVNQTFSTPAATVAVLTFPELADGNYQLRVLAAKVNAGNFDGNGDGQPGDDFILNFHRLFGDVDGNRTVDFADFLSFRASFGAASGGAFDSDGDGDVDLIDFLQFRGRFGTVLTP